MKIVCTIERKGGTKVNLDGESYHFKPEHKRGPHVCDVENEAHIKRFLAISECYKPAEGIENPLDDGIRFSEGEDEGALILTNEQVEDIAKTCHAVNNAHNKNIKDPVSPPWEQLGTETRQMALDGVEYVLTCIANGEPVTPDKLHQHWLDAMVDNGWTVGPHKDPVKKQHPAMIPYDELPPVQQEKAVLFIKTVRQRLAVMTGEMDEMETDYAHMEDTHEGEEIWEEQNNDFLMPTTTDFDENDEEETNGMQEIAQEADAPEPREAEPVAEAVTEPEQPSMNDVLDMLLETDDKDVVVQFFNDNVEYFPEVSLDKRMSVKNMVEKLRESYSVPNDSENAA